MNKQEADLHCEDINRRMTARRGGPDRDLPYPNWFYRRQTVTEFRTPGTSWYCVNAPENLAGQRVTVLSYPYIIPGYYPHYDVTDRAYSPAPAWGQDIRLADGTIIKAYQGGLWDHIPW